MIVRYRARGRAPLAALAAAAVCASCAPAAGAPPQGGERVPVLVTLRPAVATGADGPGVVRHLRAHAARSQARVTRGLSAPVRGFWLVNAFAARVTPGELRALRRRPEVVSVTRDVPVSRVAAVRVSRVGGGISSAPGGPASPWALERIDARGAWAQGVRGAGVRIGSIDTGVDLSAPGITGKVVAWRDFTHGRPDPHDPHGHGTFTVSQMVGDTEGVAPGAHVVVAKAFGADGMASPSALLAAAEWMTDPDGDPATADHPAVVNGSWAAEDADADWFRPMVDTWLALGIVPVFSAGNSGPGPGTVQAPATLSEVLAVGAVDERGAVAEFSSRGGGDRGSAVKPDLVAPGDSVPGFWGRGAALGSGTSVAAPLVSGTVALMRQAAPDVPARTVMDHLRRTALDLGPAGPDPDYGSGLVRASAAVAAVRGVAAPVAVAATSRAGAPLVRLRAASHRTGHLVVHGHLTARAGVRVTVTPVAATRRAGPVLIRTAGPVAGTFRLTLPVRGLAPGLYRLTLGTRPMGSATWEAGSTRVVRLVR